MEQLSYKELQKLAKEQGIPANLSKKQLVKKLSASVPASENAADIDKSSKASDHQSSQQEPKAKKKKISSSSSSSNSKASSKLVPSGEFEVPRYWGSPLEGCDDLSTALDEFIGNEPRFTSLSLIREPFLMAICRKNGIALIKEDCLEYLRQVIKNFVETAVTTCSNADELTAETAVMTCEKMGLPVLGATTFQYLPAVDLFNDLGVAKESSTDNIHAKFWNGFRTNVLAPWREVKELSYSLALMRRLVDTDRASLKDPTVASTVGFICHILDDDTFRYMMSFLLTRDASSNESCGVGKKLMLEDIEDTWNTNFEDTLEDTIAAGVDVLTECDDHTDINYLHNQVIFGHHHDCQKLIEMGIDPNEPCGEMFENGDGWGELEYTNFTPLHFAACNGKFFTSRNVQHLYCQKK